MELKVGSKISGFTITRIREEKEIDGRLVEMVHDISGAQLVWVDNKDVNKLFSIGFKTLPENSTGVFHILEHSVLNGSDKYPVKEPFVDLIKGSMNTFLNAMTFQDKTMYPVSSRNERDFLNLTSVYLDAVFAPRILKDPNILYQEGWHIEQDEEGDLSYKGVVFNEMKGALSDADGFLSEEMITVLYPDNCYGVNSGGDPAVITDLTYEEFIKTYKRFYHPSNAKVFLDGDVPLEKTLEMIDGYLSKSGRLEDLPSFKLQVPGAFEKTVDYALAKEESDKDKGRLVAGKIFAGPGELEKMIAAEILFSVLTGTNDSPLKKAVLDSGLAQDVNVDTLDDIPQASFMMQFKNIKDGKEDELWKLARDTCFKLAEEGIDPREITAALNRSEFNFKSPQEPAGLIRCIKAFVTWLHGGDPMAFLAVDGLYKSLREKQGTGYYEALLKELMSDENMCKLHARASYTAADEKDEAEKKRLEAIRASWTEEDLAANKKMNELLVKWQQSEDSPEAKATLPKLPLSEVSEDPQWDATDLKDENGVAVMYHPVPSRGIVNFSLYFSLADKTLEELSDLNGLSRLLGELPTTNHTSAELARDIKTYLGSLTFKLNSFERINGTGAAMPNFCVSASVLKENLSIAEDLIKEILLTTDFSDKDKIKNIMVQSDMGARQALVGAGHAYAAIVAASGYSSAAAASDAIGGYTFVRRLHELVENFDERFEAYSSLLAGSLKDACCRSRLIASETATEYVPLSRLINSFPVGTCAGVEAEYKSGLPAKAGIRIPSLTGFSAQSYKLSEKDGAYDGSLGVASNILSFDFLWNQVRVQGGAYGTGFRANAKGYISTYSFRDPTPARSVGINKQLGDHLRKICEARVPLDNFIIAAVAATEPLLSPEQRGALADQFFLTGVSFDTFKTTRLQMLSTDYDKLLWCAKIADTMAENGRVAVVGQESQLAEFKDMKMLDL